MANSRHPLATASSDPSRVSRVDVPDNRCPTRDLS